MDSQGLKYPGYLYFWQMRHLILYDDPAATRGLFPFSLTRPIGDFRVGITRLSRKWAHYLDGVISFNAADYLREKYPGDVQKDNWFIFSHVIANPALAAAIGDLSPGEGLFSQDRLLAWRSDQPRSAAQLRAVQFTGQFHLLEYPFQIFHLNAELINQDFDMLTKGRRSAKISDTNHLTARKKIFIEEGALVEHSFLNASKGPIYIGKNAEIMEGAMIRGPFSMGEGSVVKMGSTIYGATSLGPYCRMGGEIKNTVVFGYSNKAHEGYLGDAVIGEWCNLGANTNCSNLKNNVGNVKVWNEPGKTYLSAGRTCGLLMGDYSRSGISTMFNTGTVTGVSCNIFGGDFPPKYIPSFSWGGAAKWMLYDLDKAIQNARSWMKMKQVEMSPAEEHILRSIFTSAHK